MPDKTESLRVINADDGHTLTTDEIAELKRLAAMSKMARMIIALVVGALTLVGVDKVMSFFASLTAR